MPPNPIGYFEIPAADLERAVAFYRGVFAYGFERTVIDGNDMALFPWDEGAPGVSGALACGDSYLPSHHGTRVYFEVESIEATLARVHAHRGRTLYPRTSIGELGFVAEFEDSEGNRLGLHEFARERRDEE